MNNAKRLLLNTCLLTASAFLMRTVLVSFNIYLSNRIGAEGIGLFQLISSVYSMAITFSVAGVRLASMRMVADSLALGYSNQRAIMKRGILYAVLCGFVTGAVLLLFAEPVSVKWIGSADAVKSLKILCVSLPFVSASAALNGYFTSESKILRYTFVQFFEQAVKISVSVFMLSKCAHSVESSCAAIVTGISVGEMFSLSCSYIIYRFTSKTETQRRTEGIFGGLLRIALPDAFGSEMRSILSTAEHMLIPRGLKKSGSSADASIATYGVIHGMSLPVVLYPSALLSSLSGLLVPEISAHHISGNRKQINYMIHRVMHLTLLFSIGTAGIMYFFADSLSAAFYSETEAGFYIRVLALLIPVMYCDMSVDGMLKGLDQQVQYMKYNIIDALSCVLLVYFLVPKMSVKGYVFVIFFSEILNFALSIHRLTVVAQVELDLFRDLIAPVCSAVISCMVLKIFYVGGVGKGAMCVLIFVCVLLYTMLLRLFRAIDNEELQWIRKVFREKKI